MRREAALRFDGGEVLQVVAAVAAQVLDEPVEQRGEVQRVPRGRHIVIAVRVDRCAVAGDAPVGRAGEGEEQRRAERLAVRRGVGLADRPRINLAARQRRGVLPPPGGPVPPLAPVGCHLAAHPGPADFLIEFGEQLVQVLGVFPGSRGLVAAGLDLGAVLDPPLLVVGGGVGLEVGFAVEVPAFAALRGAQVLGPFGARRADRGEGVPAGDEHLLGFAGGQVGAAQLDRADAAAVLDGDVFNDVTGQRHGHPLRPCRLASLGHRPSPPAGTVTARTSA